MTYHAHGTNSCLDSIRLDIAEMLNLQEKKIKHERALMDGGLSETQLESIQHSYQIVSAQFMELRNKYNIK